MMRSGKGAPASFVYVQRSDGFLLHGISPGESKAHAPIVIWKPPRSFDWARRFSTVDNAAKCIRDYHIEGATVIDRAGRVLRVVRDAAMYGRMCETQKLCSDACPLNNHESSICYTVGRAITDTSIEQVEQIIMDWAAAHPEPVYPTWMEWLSTIGLCEPDGEGYRIRVEEFKKPMPTYIAQTLCVRPKEG